MVGNAVTAASGDVDPTHVYVDKSIQFTGGEYTDEEFHYRLMKPVTVDPEMTYPLVVFLHGAGERGNDNQKQLAYFRHKWPSRVTANASPVLSLLPSVATIISG